MVDGPDSATIPKTTKANNEGRDGKVAPEADNAPKAKVRPAGIPPHLRARPTGIPHIVPPKDDVQTTKKAGAGGNGTEKPRIPVSSHMRGMKQKM